MLMEHLKQLEHKQIEGIEVSSPDTGENESQKLGVRTNKIVVGSRGLLEEVWGVRDDRQISDPDSIPCDEAHRCCRPQRQMGIKGRLLRTGVTAPKDPELARVPSSKLSSSTMSRATQLFSWNEHDDWGIPSWFGGVGRTPSHEAASTFESEAASSVETRCSMSCSTEEPARERHLGSASCPSTSAGSETPLLKDAAAEHRARQLVTGSICMAVCYSSVRQIARDVLKLRVVDKRLFVVDLELAGRAYQVGVRPGDELVRIKVGQGIPQQPEASAQALEVLATDPLFMHQPIVSLFMGFAGKLPAEVRVTHLKSPVEDLPANISTLMDDCMFELLDYAERQPKSLFFAYKQPNTESEAGSVAPHSPGAPWNLIEVERRDAQQWLAIASRAAAAASGPANDVDRGGKDMEVTTGFV
mmetsp:Transcript_13608/g.26305  ORF Transcript_13608/g.26305 Transcript_13608/m.26305 type:complete len:415 (-) Transcript_13608:29-1273(-)